MSSLNQSIIPSNKRKLDTVPESPLRQRKSCLKKEKKPVPSGTIPNKGWVIKENPDYYEDASYKPKISDAPKKDGEFSQICKYARANGFGKNLFGCHDKENDENHENHENKGIIANRYAIIERLHVSEDRDNL